MTKGTATFIIVLASLLALSACNFPTSQGTQVTPSAGPMVTLRTAAEVYSGPGPGYELVGTLDPGQQVEAVGMSADGAYLLILHPDMPLVLGWMRYDPSTVAGSPIDLPIATPPPTPTLPPPSGSGCPSPVPSGPTPVYCGPTAPPPSGGCPSPVPSGPTPVSCGPAAPPPSGSGCPSPVPSGPTPVSCGPTAPPYFVPTLPQRRLPTLPPTAIGGPTPPS